MKRCLEFYMTNDGMKRNERLNRTRNNETKHRTGAGKNIQGEYDNII